MRGTRFLYVLATLVIVVTLGEAWMSPAVGLFVLVVVSLPVAGWAFAYGRLTEEYEATQPAFDRVSNLVARGLHDRAEAELQAIAPTWIGRPRVARMAAYQRAQMAFARGDAAGAVRHAADASGAPRTTLSRSWELWLRAQALGLRALAHATLGDAAAALADAEAAEATHHAPVATVARLELARAVILSRSDDRTALAAHFQRTGRLMLEHGTRRERALVRTLHALTGLDGASGDKSVYRAAVRPNDTQGAGAEASPLAKWFGALFPKLVDLAPPEPAAIELPLAPPKMFPEAMHDIAAARRVAAQMAGGRRVGLLLAITLGVMPFMAFLTLWQFLTPADRPPHPEHLSPSSSLPPPDPIAASDGVAITPLHLILVGILVAIVLFGVRRSQRARRRERRMLEAELTTARGQLEAGVAVLEKISRERAPEARAAACLRLAMLANRCGSFARAVDEADRGLVALGVNGRPNTLVAGVHAPLLLGERAFALAARGRTEEAETELASLAATYPSHVANERYLLPVRLLSAIRDGRFDEAAELARTRSLDMPIDFRVDLLADIALVTSGSADLALRERVVRELRAFPDVRSWLGMAAGPNAPRVDLAA